MTITLRDGDLALTIAPDRGAEVRSLEFRGVEFLYQAPWSPTPLPPQPIESTPWAQAWHGGWQFLWPNAGAECTVDGVQHGFHGAGSVAPFSVIEQDAARAVLRCELDDLVCERGFELQDGRVRATASIRNDGPRATSLIAVEHLILGGPPGSRGDAHRARGRSRHRAGVGRNAGSRLSALAAARRRRPLAPARDDLAVRRRARPAPPARPASPPPTG